MSEFPAVDDFLAWVHDAAPNERYVYHIGLLGYERHSDPTLDALGDAVYVAASIHPPLVLLHQLRATFPYGTLKGQRKDDNAPRNIYFATRTKEPSDGSGA
jgi:hypothetical protein